MGRIKSGGAAATKNGQDKKRDRKSVVEGKSVDLGGRRTIKKKKTITIRSLIQHHTDNI